MRLHVRVPPPTIGTGTADFGEHLAAVEGHEAVAGVFVPDSPLLWNDTLVTLASWVPRFPTIPFTIAATNFVMRHWAVLRNATNIIARESQAGLRVGVARGDSAVRDVGLKPQPIPEFMAAFRAFVTPEERDIRRTPALIATNGRRLMRFAGAHADGVILQIGVDETVVTESIAYIHEGAESAGRDPSDVSIILSALFIDSSYDSDLVDRLVTLKYGAMSQRDPRILQKMGIPPMPKLQEYVDLAHPSGEIELSVDPGALEEFRERYLIPRAAHDAARLFERLEGLGVTELSLMDLQHNAPPDGYVAFIENVLASQARA